MATISIYTIAERNAFLILKEYDEYLINYETCRLAITNPVVTHQGKKTIDQGPKHRDTNKPIKTMIRQDQQRPDKKILSSLQKPHEQYPNQEKRFPLCPLYLPVFPELHDRYPEDSQNTTEVLKKTLFE